MMPWFVKAGSSHQHVYKSGRYAPLAQVNQQEGEAEQTLYFSTPTRSARRWK